MDLKSIIAISGMNGLYKMVSKAKGPVIVENILDKRKQPVFALNTVSAIDEITVYVDGGTVPLKELLAKIYDKEKGGKISAGMADNKILKQYFAEVLPQYDREKVYPSDMKKIIHWYNILLDAGLLKPDENPAPTATEEKPAEEIKQNETAK